MRRRLISRAGLNLSWRIVYDNGIWRGVCNTANITVEDYTLENLEKSIQDTMYSLIEQVIDNMNISYHEIDVTTWWSNLPDDKELN